MANKTFKTRILLKYDSYTNWTTNNPVLKAGEVAIAYIADTVSNQLKQIPEDHSANRPILMKVGDGVKEYNKLPFVSALAADVYDWAKKAKPEINYTDILDYTEYRIVEANGDYKLQICLGGEGTWIDAPNDSATIPLAKVVSDLSALTATVTGIRTDLGNKTDAANAEGSAFARIAHLMGNGEGSIADQIGDRLGLLSNLNETLGVNETLKTIKQSDGEVIVTTQEIEIPYSKVTDFDGGVGRIIETLDSTAETEDSNPIKIKVIQTDGKLNEVITASIAEGTYAPGDVLDSLDLADKDVPSSDVATDEEGGISTLSYIDTVTQVDGQVSATKKTVTLNSPYSATNKVATMKDITDETTKLMGDITGAMHFKGVSTTNPLITPTGATVAGVSEFEDGDVVLYTFVEADATAGDETAGLAGVTAEYVYSKGKWYKLGDESIAQKLIDTLNLPEVTITANQTFSSISQVKGQLVVGKPQEIEIPYSKVTGFDDGVEGWVNSNLNNTPSSTGPVKVTVTQTNGKITAVDASITEGTYAPGNVLAGLTYTSDDITGESIEKASGTSIIFINKVAQNEGQLSAERTELVFNQAYDSSTNKIATMNDIPALAVETGDPVNVTANTIDVTAKLVAKNVSGHTLTAPVATVPTVAGVENQITNRLATFDNEDAIVSDQWVTAAVQVDGQVAVSRSDIKINQLAENTVENYVIFDCGDSLTMTGA